MKVRLRMLQPVAGTFHLDCATGKRYYDVQRGDIVELDADHAARYIDSKLCEPA